MGTWRAFIADQVGSSVYGKRRLTADEADLILGGNAERIYGLDR
jgi:hypothetical protein